MDTGDVAMLRWPGCPLDSNLHAVAMGSLVCVLTGETLNRAMPSGSGKPDAGLGWIGGCCMLLPILGYGPMGQPAHSLCLDSPLAYGQDSPKNICNLNLIFNLFLKFSIP